MDCPLRVSPEGPPTTPPVLRVQASRTYSTLAWVETELRRERQVIESGHIELLKRLEEHLSSLAMHPTENSLRDLVVDEDVWPRDQLPGVVGGTGETPPGPEPITTVPKPHWQPEQHRMLEQECQVTEGDHLRLSSPGKGLADDPEHVGTVAPEEVTSERTRPESRGSGARTSARTSFKRSQSRKMDQIVGRQDLFEMEVEGFFGHLEAVVKSTQFEMLFSGLIMANTVVMCFEAQYRGFVAGTVIEYSAAYTGADDSWPHATEAFAVMEWIFGVLFTLELTIKIAGLRRQFISDAWNGIDLMIVFSWLLTALQAVQLPLSPVMLRLCRLARLLRLLRLVRTIRGFDKLYLITTALKGSSSILIWSMMLLVIMQAMLALFFQAVLEPYVVENDPETRTARLEVYKFYGTFARNMLTMFEITLGNWMPPTRALVENVDELYMLFFLSHKLVIGFALVAVLNGVFIQETFRVAAMDDRVMMMQKERMAKTHTAKMHELFVHADKDGNGALDKEEFIEALENPAIMQWLGAMELDVQDAGIIFDLCDVDGDGELTAEELVKGAGRLKGAARSIDLAGMIRDQKELCRDVAKLKTAATVAASRSPARTAALGYC